jgi:prepilin-type N-terminal cleavage/methylation domain-containing protein
MRSDLRKPEGTRRHGFTLIEVLVVVAIIALLISILLPSLSRAKAMTRMVQCQSNLKQLATAFATYSVGSKGRLPGAWDVNADWLGHLNKPGVPGLAYGRNPEDGTIYKYMGKNKLAYACPDDNVPRDFVSNPQDSRYSYTSNTLLSGAKVEMLAGAHYRRSGDPKDPKNFNETDHTRDMRPLPGVPMIVEEDPTNYLIYVDDSCWSNLDCLAARHMATGNNPGFGNIAFHDTHIGREQLTPQSARGVQQYFRYNSMCMRTRGGKWISGLSWSEPSGDRYGFLEHASPASAYGVNH